MQTIRTIAAGAATIALAVGIAIAADAGAPSRNTRPTALEEPASLYVFAEQPQGCTPGYISINHARGATWTVAGAPTAVTPPSTKIELPGGFQDDVVATALPGYSIPSNVQSEFFLTVYPIPLSCYRQPSAAPTPSAETPGSTGSPSVTTPATPATPSPSEGTPATSEPATPPAQPTDAATTTPGPISCEAR
ncbi:hypothetical protein ABFU82_22475 [Nocardioides sp. WV_118_6]